MRRRPLLLLAPLLLACRPQPLQVQVREGAGTALIFEWSSPDPASASLLLTGEDGAVLELSSDQATEHRLAVLGLPPLHSFDYQLIQRDADGSSQSDSGSLQTPGLPSFLPDLQRPVYQ